MNNITHKRFGQDETEDHITESKGKLKIFFGIAPGVGKTRAMLQDAQKRLSEGVDMVIAVANIHGQSDLQDIIASIGDFSSEINSDEVIGLNEVDLDAVLNRRPALVVMDDLAHTNSSGGRHTKRYQEILELLDNGINVYTTANILQLESQVDTIMHIAGITIQDTFPDAIFEMADDVILVDMAPGELQDRFDKGKITHFTDNEKDLNKLYNKTTLIELREITLRLLTNHTDNQLKKRMKQKKIAGPVKSGLHMLVLVGPSTSSAKLIRWARNMSYTMGAKLIALHVENTQVLTNAQNEQLSKNIDLARRFGAEVVITSGNDLVVTTLEVAKRENVTHIVIGKSGKQSFLSSVFFKGDFVNRLLKESGQIDIYVIEPGLEARQYKRNLFSYPDFTSSYKSYIMAVLAVLVTVLLCLPISEGIGYQSVSFIMLFVILILSMFFRLGPVLLASAISAVSWNFFLIPPEFTMKISKASDLLAFGTFFLVAIVTGTLTAKVRRQEALTRKREERTNALFHLTNDLAGARNTKDVLEIAKASIKKYFGKDVFFLLQDGNGVLKKKKPVEKLKDFSGEDYNIAQWVFDNTKKAGKFTGTLALSDYTFYPMKGIGSSPGVVLVKQEESLNGENELFWDTFFIQISNALEQHYFARMAKRVTQMDEHEKVYKSFFEVLSQELRKPLKALDDSAYKLHSDKSIVNGSEKHVDDLIRYSTLLSHLTENLLTLSKLESNEIVLKENWYNIADIFGQVAESMKSALSYYTLDIDIVSPMPLVKIDERLIKQVLYNLLFNSCQYSKVSTAIFLKAYYKDNYLIIQEMDRGTGFLPDALPRAFEKYYKSGKNDDGLGLGLFIVKGLVEIHNGTINVENRQNGGSRFTIRIPAESSFVNVHTFNENEE